ncbi:hypothetical protein ISS85_01160 [Candidatus Microgenomates bacterium]|nr:hypothetical protein [Candidatus Microgenomates bacterium]
MPETEIDRIYRPQRVNPETHRGGCAANCGYMALRILGAPVESFEDYIQKIKEVGGSVVDETAETLTFGSIATLATNLGFSTKLILGGSSEYYEDRLARDDINNMERTYINEVKNYAQNYPTNVVYEKRLNSVDVEEALRQKDAILIMGLSWPGLYGQFIDDEKGNKFFNDHAVIIDEVEISNGDRKVHIIDPYVGDVHAKRENPIGEKEYWLTEEQFRNAELEPGGAIIIRKVS